MVSALPENHIFVQLVVGSLFRVSREKIKYAFGYNFMGWISCTVSVEEQEDKRIKVAYLDTTLFYVTVCNNAKVGETDPFDVDDTVVPNTAACCDFIVHIGVYDLNM